ncbi:hypothetical protein ACVOMS_34925 [Bradyrhizobium guangxiense]
MSDTNLASLTLESLRDLMQNSGYRVELVSDAATNVSLLRSSTAGFAFDIRPGNRLANDEKSCSGFHVQCVAERGGRTAARYRQPLECAAPLWPSAVCARLPQ